MRHAKTADTMAIDASPATHQRQHRHQTHQEWLRWGKRLLMGIFLVLVPWLLYQLIQNLDWAEVTTAIGSFSGTTLLLAVAAAFTSYFIYTGFDLLGRHYTGHHLPARQIIPVTFVCYAFNLNLSAWVGGIALRYRLYSRLGLDLATITRILSFSLITNWLGYVLVAGVVFSMRVVRLPASWELGATGLQWLGFALIAVGVCYLLACRFSSQREWHIRGHEITLPEWHIALLQAVLGAVNWLLMASVIFLLLPDKASYPAVLSILLIASIAGVISHIPAGLGVLETVFITMLQHQFSHGTLMAALIGYRAIYFLLPLAIAVIVYLVLEKNAKKLARKNAA
ncbi:MAG TPA: lysylphosphatidylglycerol synthase domain-containing protein [Dongiaceae bacterium]|nr:lysylphosphatidylglycerol synthase domain-containing protein [Dongiaceae bacterium]